MKTTLHIAHHDCEMISYLLTFKLIMYARFIVFLTRRKYQFMPHSKILLLRFQIRCRVNIQLIIGYRDMSFIGYTLILKSTLSIWFTDMSSSITENKTKSRHLKAECRVMKGNHIIFLCH